MSRTIRKLYPTLGTILTAGGLAMLGLHDARAEFCWSYVDNHNAKAPFACVQQGDGVTPCFWNPNCHKDGDPSDCCTAVSVPGPENILTMHTAWHACFGNVGAPDGNNPPGRGQRWYAFHRQFELDFNLYRDTLPWPHIQSLDWCPNMLMPYGFDGCELAPGAHPAGCGVGPNRPDNVHCINCIAFPHCLFVGGGGPIACPSAPSSVCQGNGVSYPYTSLDQFKNVEEVATVLDDYFHGHMHSAVAGADNPGYYCQDVITPACSPRDPMFWRLHKALDDVVRAWQNIKAADVMLVIDRSGSMIETDAGSGMTKIAAALDAARMFADLLDIGRSDGQTNRIGVISYSTDASDPSRNLGLINADATLLNPGGPLDTVLTNIATSGPGGATSIGAGVEAAEAQLCPPGDCSAFIPPPGANSRKALLVLTDGMENTSPCLRLGSDCPFFPSGTDREIDYSKLDFAQMCAVGFGQATSLNGELLTLVAERQGGIYMQNQNAPGTDLKDFFAKCFGQLSDEFIGLDPKGTLGPDQPVSPPIEYTSCDDGKITFAAGWQAAISPGSLRLVVTTPSGSLVRAGDPEVEASARNKWAFTRTRLPYKAESSGTWRAHLMRPHQTFVNGFTTDAFADGDAGSALARREIQRLCPDGCGRVLYFEDGRLGKRSAYEEALKVEVAEGLLPGYTQAADAVDFASRLTVAAAPWDLIVYAHQFGTQEEPYDGLLASRLCQGQRAIVTDTRLTGSASEILNCAGAQLDGKVNWTKLVGDGRLVDGTLALTNPGYPVATYGLMPPSGNVQATNENGGGGIMARSARGVAQNWFVDVLVSGLSRLDPSPGKIFIKTGGDLEPTVRILPSFIHSGGYDKVAARVEIERPLIGIGTFLAKAGLKGGEAPGDPLDPREATLAGLPALPTTTESFSLNDAGVDGDEIAGNGFFSTKVPGLAAVDGPYRLRYSLDLTTGSCTTHRELVQTAIATLDVDPQSTPVTVASSTPRPDGSVVHSVTLLPQDRLGNLAGPGLRTPFACGPAPGCQCDPRQIVDDGHGLYTVPVVTAPGTPIASCVINAFGTSLTIPAPGLCIGSAFGEPGQRVTVPITLDNGDGIAGFQVDVGFDPTLLNPVGVRLGADTTGDGWFVTSALVGFGQLRVLGSDSPPAGLPAGAREVALVDFDVSTAAPVGPLAPFSLSNCVLSDAQGVRIPCNTCPQPGRVTVRPASSYRFRPIDSPVGVDQFDPLPFPAGIEALTSFGAIATAYNGTANLSVGPVCAGTLAPATLAFASGVGTNTFRIACCLDPLLPMTRTPLQMQASDPAIAISGMSGPFQGVAKADVNADDAVNILDVTRAVNFALNLPVSGPPLSPPIAFQKWAANMLDQSCAVDAFINVLDVVRIRNKALMRPPLCLCSAGGVGASAQPAVSPQAPTAPFTMDVIRAGAKDYLVTVRGAADLSGLQIALRGAGPKATVSLEGLTVGKGWQASTTLDSGVLRILAFSNSASGLSGDGAVLRISGGGSPRIDSVVAADSLGRDLRVRMEK